MMQDSVFCILLYFTLSPHHREARFVASPALAASIATTNVLKPELLVLKVISTDDVVSTMLLNISDFGFVVTIQGHMTIHLLCLLMLSLYTTITPD